jgi:hypothetical protein
VALNCFLDEIKIPEKATVDAAWGKKDEDYLLIAIKQYIGNKENLWPELLRLVIKYKKTNEFLTLDDQLIRICDKL